MTPARWFPLVALSFSAAIIAGSWSCGALLCGRSGSADCPCMPADDGVDTDGGGSASTAGSIDDDGGCARSGEVRCMCGVAPDGDSGESSSSGTSGGDACDVETPVTLYLSADDSNSMSSPVQARAAVLDAWSSITAVPIRPWEFFNYYDFDYPPAPAGTVAISAEFAVARDAPDQFALQIGVRSEALSELDRPPVSVTLVLDTSGSMGGEPLELLKEICRATAANLREGDRLSMVTWNSEQSVVLAGHVVVQPDDPTLLAAIDALEAGGSTDLHAGLTAGYDLAVEAALPGRVSRLLLISDGGANTGVTDVDLIAAHAGSEEEDGIYLVGVGVGSAATYRDTLMDTVTDVGKGASVFVPDKAEAWRMFDERFVNTLMIAARDVQVRVDLPPGFAIERFSGEQYSTDPAEVEPQHLAPNDAMVFYQRVETCAPELVTPESALTVTARYLDAITFEQHEVSITRTFAELFADASPRLAKGTAMIAYTDALTAKRVSSPSAPKKVEEALSALADADAVLPGDPALAELRAVLEAF